MAAVEAEAAEAVEAADEVPGAEGSQAVEEGERNRGHSNNRAWSEPQPRWRTGPISHTAG